MTRKVSKYQALFRYFPDRPWSTEYATLRTVRLTGRPLGDEYETVKTTIARLISVDYARKVDREARARIARAVRREERDRSLRILPVQNVAAGLVADQVAANAFLASLGATKGTEVSADGQRVEGAHERVMGPESVDLRLIDENSEVQGAIFPTLFLCDSCHRYYNLDPNGAESLRCTFHKEDSELHQLNVVYSCPRCANIEPLLPYNTFSRKLATGWIHCTSGHGLFLDIGANLSDAHWRCEVTSCPSNINTQRVNRLCSICNISDEELLAGETTSIMAPRSATSGEIAVPLTVTFVRDAQGRDVQLASLKTQHRDTMHSFTMSTVEPSAAKWLRRLGATEIFDVPQIQSLLAVYGYRSEIRPKPPVPDDERYPRFFQVQPGVQRFRAFATITEGRGLIIGLNKTKLARLLSGGNGEGQDYERRFMAESENVARLGLQDLLTADGEKNVFVMTKLLHAIEHALRSSLVTEIGLEDFDSRMLVADAAILFFETRDLADGGITQLSQHSGQMTSWLVRGIRRIQECPQLCDSSCIACIKTDNTSCHGFLTREYNRWMPPNLLLDRTIAVDWIQQNDQQ